MLWAAIADFPEYEVSEDGRIRSFRQPSDGRTKHRAEGLVMKPFTDPRGYQAVMIRKPGDSKPHRRMIHRLVAMAFLPNPDNLPEVAHRDGNPRHNHKNNLRWSTHFDNQMDMAEHGTMQYGERSCTAKLTAKQIEEIKARHKEGGRGMGVTLAKEYGISTAQISRIVNGSRWRHLLP